MDWKFLRKPGFVLGVLVSAALLGKAHAFPVVVVDKSKNEIHMAEYTENGIELRKKWHVTLGKALGDKEVEKDLKTPEGIYFFTWKITPPALKKKFGRMALMVNYPNPIDKIAGKTGYDIMLHATDTPARLKLDRDSEGCIVVDNHEIEEIAKSVRLGLTPILVYPELKPEHLAPSSKTELRQAFQRWLDAWNGKDIDTYIGSYADNFRFNGMNLKQYRAYKKSLNDRYAAINVKADRLRFYSHPKYDAVTFTQIYESKWKNGARAFVSSGTKVLYFVKKDGTYKIADESYSNLIEN